MTDRAPISVHVNEAGAIGSGDAAVQRARAQGRVAILDPVTRQLTGLRTGRVTLEVTNESMRAYTGEASLALVTGRTTVRVVAAAGAGARVDVDAPVVEGNVPGGAVEVAPTGDGGRPVIVDGDRPGQD